MITKKLNEKEKVKKTTKTAKKKPKNKYNPQGIDEVIWAYLPEWIQQSDKYNPTIKGLLAVLMSLDVAFEGKKDEDGFFFRSSENLDKDCAMAGLDINSEYRGRVIGLMKKMGLIDHEAGWRNKNAKKGQCSRFKILVGEEEINQTDQVSDKQGVSKEYLHLNNKYKNNDNNNPNFNKKENVNSNYNQKENYNSNDNQNENVKSNDKGKINSNPNQNDKDNLNLKYTQKEISNQKDYTNANDNTNALREAVPFRNREEFNRYANHNTWSAMEPQESTSSKLVEDDFYHHPWLNDDEPDALPF